MKRITHVVNPKGVRSDALTRCEDRIRRQVDQAIASAEDNAAEANDAAESIIDGLGTSSGKEDTGKLQDRINKYLALREEAWGWNRQVKFLNELKTKLDEEVDITVNAIPVHVVKEDK